MQKCHEEAKLKSKSEVRLLVKEVKSLRSSQLKLRRELKKFAEERTEFEVFFQLNQLHFELDACKHVAILIRS